MTKYPLHYTDNANSWSRIAMLLRLYWPEMKQGYLAIAVAPGAILFIVSLIYSLTGYFSSVFAYTSFILMVSPILLTKRDYRGISSQLPVTAGEKLGFLLLTFWIAVPATFFLSGVAGYCVSLWLFGHELMSAFESYAQQLLSMPVSLGSDGMLLLVSYLITSEVSTIVLYYVVTTKRNRIVAAFACYLSIYLVFMVYMGIGGAIVGFTGGLNGLSETEAAQRMEVATPLMLEWAFILLGAVCLVYIFRLFKKLRNCGF